MFQDTAQLQAAIKGGILSQREIAKRAGIARETLSRLVMGNTVRDAHVIIRRVLNVIRQAEKEKNDDALRKVILNGSRSKEQWLNKIGGFRADESQTMLRKRIAEIEQLEKLLVSGCLTSDEIEQVQRRLCELKGIDFDGYDPVED